MKRGGQRGDTVKTAREKIAHLFAKAKEIYFTSGGIREADNWALQMAAATGAWIGKKLIIVSAIRHHAVLKPGEVAGTALGFRGNVFAGKRRKDWFLREALESCDLPGYSAGKA